MKVTALAAVAIAVLVAAKGVDAQRAAGPPPARSARASAPVDLTGYWVSVVTEDWRWRMLTPPKGDYQSVPLNAEGRRVADTWDLARDTATGNACKAFGVGGIMRQPGRLHIFWRDDATLQVDADAGTQTRLLRFEAGPPASSPPSWQGHSAAQWQGPAGATRGRGAGTAGPIVPGGGGAGLRGGPPPRGAINEGGTLKVVTTGFRAGYLRKNGVPYSESAVITEYFDRLPPHPNGDVWLLVVTTVEDPKYLSQPFYTSTHFKLEPDGSRWKPTPCRTEAPSK